MVEHRVPFTRLPPERTDPANVATAVGVVATGVLMIYRSLARSGPTVDEVLPIMLGITLPTTIADQLDRRWGLTVRMAFSVVHRLSSADSVDFTETGAFLLGVVQLVLAAVGFGLIFVVGAAFRLTRLNPTPESAVLSVLLRVVPAVGLGAGVPYLVQRRDEFGRKARSRAAGAAGPGLTFGTYLLLFGYHPVSSVIFAVAYLTSRGAALVGIFAGAWIRTALG